jgi:hypothetical protein
MADLKNVHKSIFDALSRIQDTAEQAAEDIFKQAGHATEEIREAAKVLTDTGGIPDLISRSVMALSTVFNHRADDSFRRVEESAVTLSWDAGGSGISLRDLPRNQHRAVMPDERAAVDLPPGKYRILLFVVPIKED